VIVKLCPGTSIDTDQVVAGFGSALYPVMTTTLLLDIPGAEFVPVVPTKPTEATATPGEGKLSPDSCVPSCLNSDCASSEENPVVEGVSKVDTDISITMYDILKVRFHPT
jgi:hypothetical protein